MGKAQEQYDIGRTRLHSRVLVQAKKMEALGAKSNKVIEIDDVAALGLQPISKIESASDGA